MHNVNKKSAPHLLEGTFFSSTLSQFTGFFFTTFFIHVGF